MSGQPELDFVGPDVWLLRRVRTGGVDRQGRVKPATFNLRPKQPELSLSFYDAKSVDPQRLADAAPGTGWGVVAVQTEAMRRVGFTVGRQIDANDPVFGDFHVSATPPRYDADGQIPIEIRTALASFARVILMPVQA